MADVSNTLHFLHIGKCAGTQIGHIASVAASQTATPQIRHHRHAVKLGDLPPDDPYFFSIRDPISRFVSAFYSRKRKGMPRYLSKWSPAEKACFEEFPDANDLAEGLAASGDRGRRAFCSMVSVQHIADRQADWFRGCGDFLSIRPPLWIVRQERFEADMQCLLDRAGISLGTAALPVAADDKTAHRTDYASVPPLSERSRDVLLEWYGPDVRLYALCEDWIAQQAARS